MSLRLIAKIAGAILAAIAVWIVVLNFSNFISDPFGFKARETEAAQIEAALGRGDAAVGQAQAGLAMGNAGIASARRVRDARTEETHNENSSNIRQAKDANTRLSSDLIARVNDGLCDYQSTPGCPSS